MVFGLKIAIAILRTPSGTRSTSGTSLCGRLGMLKPSRRPRAVRIGNSQLPQDCALGVLHLARLLFSFVIKAEKVQKAVDGEMRQMMGGTDLYTDRTKGAAFLQADTTKATMERIKSSSIAHGLVKDAQFAHAKEEVNVTREQLATVQDLSMSSGISPSPCCATRLPS